MTGITECLPSGKFMEKVSQGLTFSSEKLRRTLDEEVIK